MSMYLHPYFAYVNIECYGGSMRYPVRISPRCLTIRRVLPKAQSLALILGP